MDLVWHLAIADQFRGWVLGWQLRDKHHTSAAPLPIPQETSPRQSERFAPITPMLRPRSAGLGAYEWPAGAGKPRSLRGERTPRSRGMAPRPDGSYQVGLVMRFDRVPAPWRALAVLLALILGCATPAAAQMPQVFPVKPSLVPMVVAATFILPAAVAGMTSLVRRAGRAMGPLASVGVLAIVAAALVVYGDPRLLASLRI